MKIINLLILLSLTCFLFAGVSSQQDKKNIEYLQMLDKNITGTIEVLSTFNDALDAIPFEVTGMNAFSQFLMELTMECSNIKKDISDSYELSRNDREEMIYVLISSLNPEVKRLPFDISKQRDYQNKQIALVMRGRIKKHILETQKKIFTEEAAVLESKTFNKYFFNLHSQHFMYQLMMDYLEPSEKLSKENRDFLITMVQAVEDDLMEGKPPQEGGEEE
ncbi:MAG: hypothetical protein K9N09_05435 [Candidatus Cloacimonetes bacterium]|nr:hypothetical protein [Candidatus Cloacimonadota bacterium]MCF7814215.1 hypothetical protein [Candidatus Cloacimonadota bacterium]MCF7868126.1 hypothetical protein [Candidatus Cloacimonadota bacterium]MCF7883592.1 hypothetical protein [Candidatus Cloacimonadota bacterium]